MRLRQLLLALVLVAGSVLASTACGDNRGEDADSTNDDLSGTVTVFAAASLTDVFNELAGEFRKANPRVDVSFNFAGTPTLRAQLEQGARADVFASADERQMHLAAQNGVLAAPGIVFVRSTLVVITPVSNPGGIVALADLRHPGLKLVFGNPQVPVGVYTMQFLAAIEKEPTSHASGFSDAVLKNVVSLESNVKQIVAKVELGEADAGIVYRTDVTPSVAAKLRVVPVPDALNVKAEYSIALAKDGPSRRIGQAFIDFVLSGPGQVILKQYGFSASD